MVIVEDFDDADSQRIERWCEEALAYLAAPDEDLVIRRLRGAPPGAEASANSEEIRLSLDTVRLRRGGPPDWFMDLRLGYIVYEEVAHCLLHREDVPEHAEGEFFQELFASWAQTSALIVTNRLQEKYVESHPVPSEGPWYDLGKHAGASIAGLRQSERRLSAWMNNPAADQDKIQLVINARTRLGPPLVAAQVAAAFFDLG